jgi:hypothetical protein
VDGTIFSVVFVIDTRWSIGRGFEEGELDGLDVLLVTQKTSRISMNFVKLHTSPYPKSVTVLSRPFVISSEEFGLMTRIFIALIGVDITNVG